MRQEERKTIQAAIIGAVLFLLIQIFRTPLSQIENQDVMLALYLIAGCCNIAFGFAIFAQGGLFSPINYPKQDCTSQPCFWGYAPLIFYTS